MELDADTTPSARLGAPELERWPISLAGGLDVHVNPREPDPPLPPLTLRDLAAMPNRNHNVAPADPLLQGLPADPSSAAPSRTSPASKAANKALRRAQVRRKLQASQPQTLATAVSADALVLEGDETARESLCTLLAAFGFRTHTVQSSGEAVRMLAAKRYAVAFVNISFDDAASPASHELCSRVKAPARHAHDTVSALVVVTSDTARPVERVRAELAGCDAFLLKPVSRGTVARALEVCGVPLPIDSRRP